MCVCVSQLEGVVLSTDELERSVHFLDKDVLLFNILFFFHLCVVSKAWIKLMMKLMSADRKPG